MGTQYQGKLGLAAAIKHFALEGYDVYIPLTDNSKFDLVVAKDLSTQTVEVKSTSKGTSKSWSVELKSVRPNRTGNKIIKFDATGIDLLAVYVVPEDKVYVFAASDYHGRNMMSIPKKSLDSE